MKLSEFDFHVPEELVAQDPLETRDASRMMVVHRKERRIEHRRFSEISSYINRGDTMVFNQSRVIKARLIGNRDSGGKVEAFLLQAAGGNRFECLVKLTAAKKEGVEFTIADGFKGKILSPVKDSMLYLVEFDTQGRDLSSLIDAHGKVPLPPYIHREPTGADSGRYQTVYAAVPGSVAAPTAGLHFTDRVMDSLRAAGVGMEFVTLHVGLGTFQPIKVENIEAHQMHREFFSVPASIKGEQLLQKKRSGRIIAVGTTSVRALESAARGMEESTELFLKPGSEFLAVDVLFTNFHQPKSSLVVMLSAFVGDKDFLFEAYREAVAEKYRFFSYGDCMLVL